MNIRHSAPEDVERMMAIYARARRFMAEHGNPRQWGATNWPPEGLIRQDIERGKSYVCEEDGRIIGAFYYDAGHSIDPCYAEITEGAWIGSEDYGVVHRIASDGSVPGVGSFCIRWAYERCGHLRMDTHPDNLVMQSLLRKLGFHQVGIIHVQEDDDPRLAFELTDAGAVKS